MSKNTLPEMIWKDLSRQIEDIKKRVDNIEVRTERSETTSGHPSVDTLAEAPTIAGGYSGLKAGDSLWIGDARKTGEGAGLGTGLIAYYDPATDSWYRPSDDSAVVV